VAKLPNEAATCYWLVLVQTPSARERCTFCFLGDVTGNKGFMGGIRVDNAGLVASEEGNRRQNPDSKNSLANSISES